MRITKEISELKGAASRYASQLQATQFEARLGELTLQELSAFDGRAPQPRCYMGTGKL